MKKLFFFVLLWLPMLSPAQHVNKIQEIGVECTSKDAYGLTYRFGNDRALWRLRGTTWIGHSRHSDGFSINSSDAFDHVQLSFGREYRKALENQLSLRFGMDLSFAYWRQEYKTDYFMYAPFNKYHVQSQNYRPGLHLVGGMSYQINRLVLGLEVLPYITYQWNVFDFTLNNDVHPVQSYHNLSYGLNASSVLISAVYQF